MKTIAVLLLAFACLTALTALQTQPQIFTVSNNKQSATFAVDDTFEIDLPSNPDAGMVWVLDSNSTSVVQMTDEEQTLADHPTPTQPSLQSMQFRAASKGTGVLKLEYTGNDPNAPPKDTFTLNVTVK